MVSQKVVIWSRILKAFGKSEPGHDMGPCQGLLGRESEWAGAWVVPCICNSPCGALECKPHAGPSVPEQRGAWG